MTEATEADAVHNCPNLHEIATSVMGGPWNHEVGAEVKLIAALIVDLLDQGKETAVRALVSKLAERDGEGGS